MTFHLARRFHLAESCRSEPGVGGKAGIDSFTRLRWIPIETHASYDTIRRRPAVWVTADRQSLAQARRIELLGGRFTKRRLSKSAGSA